jgi:ABC-type multidrug transport system ATPase subunit
MTEAGVAPAAVAGRELVCQFGPVRAVDDLSFEVAEGEVFGLLGPNGAGKTTVIRVVTTLLRPAAGTMRVFGLDTRRSTMRLASTYSGGMVRRLELAQALVSRPGSWSWSWSWTSPPSGWTRWPAAASGNGSSGCATSCT